MPRSTMAGSVVTWARADAFIKDDEGRVSGVVVKNARDGSPQGGHGSTRSLTQLGPWTDEAACDERILIQSQLLRPTKGDSSSSSTAEKLPVKHTSSRCSIRTTDRATSSPLPWGDRTYVGTTDTDYRRRTPVGSTPRSADVDYLLDGRELLLPGATQLVREDVISTWAGLRPLDGPRAPTSSEVSESRDQPRTPNRRSEADGLISDRGRQADDLSEDGERDRGYRGAVAPLIATRRCLPTSIRAAETDSSTRYLAPWAGPQTTTDQKVAERGRRDRFERHANRRNVCRVPRQTPTECCALRDRRALRRRRPKSQREPIIPGRRRDRRRRSIGRVVEELAASVERRDDPAYSVVLSRPRSGARRHRQKVASHAWPSLIGWSDQTRSRRHVERVSSNASANLAALAGRVGRASRLRSQLRKLQFEGESAGFDADRLELEHVEDHGCGAFAMRSFRTAGHSSKVYADARLRRLPLHDCAADRCVYRAGKIIGQVARAMRRRDRTHDRVIEGARRLDLE